MEIIQQIFATVFNLAVVIISLNFFISLRKTGIKIFKFFTVISNFIALISSFICICYLIFSFTFSTLIPEWVKGIRYVATFCLLITMVVSLFILEPLKQDQKRPSHSTFFVNVDKRKMDIAFHYIIPLLSIISLILFESHPVLSLHWIFLAAIPIVLYILVYVILTIGGFWIEPYGLLISKIPTYKKIFISVSIPLCIAFLDVVLWWASILFI